MAIRPMPGLYKDERTGIWLADKWVEGVRIRKSTKTTTVTEANRFLQAEIDSVMSQTTSNMAESSEPTFRDAAIKFLTTLKRKDDENIASKISRLYPFLADKPLAKIRKGMLEPFIEKMYADGKKSSTINSYLQLVRTVLIKASDEWVWPGTDDPWLNYAPKIRMERVIDRRPGYPISWAEQHLLVSLLPSHLEPMVLFALNTGLRADKELCQLRWSWEREVPESSETYFLIPGEARKNGQPLALVLNNVAREIVDRMRKQKSSDFVFTYQDHPIRRINDDGWTRAKEQAIDAYEEAIGHAPSSGFMTINVHDMRHTFATRLGNNDVSEEDIALLLGQKRGTVTDIYSHARYHYILDKVERVASEPAGETATIRQLALVS